MFASAITSGRFIYMSYNSSSSSLALPHWTLCVCMCVSTCQLPCLFSSCLKECLFCFFQMACAVLPQYTGHFFPFAWRGSMCALLFQCNPLPLTFLYVAFLLSPFSCHCTLMTGVLWPPHCRQSHILAGISRHLSAVLGLWCLHSDVYSTWTPNVLILVILPTNARVC